MPCGVDNMVVGVVMKLVVVPGLEPEADVGVLDVTPLTGMPVTMVTKLVGDVVVIVAPVMLSGIELVVEAFIPLCPPPTELLTSMLLP